MQKPFSCRCEASTPFHRKMLALLIFCKICQKGMLFGQYFPTLSSNITAFFVNVPDMHKGEQTSVKLELDKPFLYNKQPVENATLLFLVFSFF